MIPTLFVLSLIGGLLSGLLGVGGAVVMIPMMLAIPPLVGVGSLSMNEVAGISMIQVLAASISGCLAHRRGGYVHTKTLFAIGIPMGICALVGALFSKSMDGRYMLFLFGVLVLVAFVMLLLGREAETQADAESDFTFHGPLSVTIGGSVGLLSGIVGAGGGFVLIPLMITVLGIPMRVTVGSSLGIVFIGALMGSIGKVLSLQVEWAYLLPVVVGSIPAAQIGARISKSVPSKYIRHMLVLLVFVTLVRTWWDILLGA